MHVWTFRLLALFEVTFHVIEELLTAVNAETCIAARMSTPIEDSQQTEEHASEVCNMCYAIVG